MSTAESRAHVRQVVEATYPGLVTYCGVLDVPRADTRDGIAHVFHTVAGRVAAWLVIQNDTASVLLVGPPAPAPWQDSTRGRADHAAFATPN